MRVSAPPEMRFTVVSCPATSSKMQVDKSSRLGQHVTLLLGLDQPGEQVVAGLLTALLDQRGEVLHERQDRTQPLLHRLGREQEVGIEPAGQRMGPHPELLVVLGRDTEHLHDDLHRERVGVVGHEVDLAALEGFVEQPVADLLEPGPQAFDDSRGERLLHEAPEAGVVGWVSEQKRCHLGQHGFGPLLRRGCRRRGARGRSVSSTLRPSLLERRSRRMARQSAWRVNTQNPSALRCTGLLRRNSRYTA